MWLVVICIVRVGHNVFLQICTHSVHKLLEMVPCCFFCPPPALILVASVSAMHLYWHDIYSPPLLLDIGRKYWSAKHLYWQNIYRPPSHFEKLSPVNFSSGALVHSTGAGLNSSQEIFAPHFYQTQHPGLVSKKAIFWCACMSRIYFWQTGNNSWTDGPILDGKVSVEQCCRGDPSYNIKLAVCDIAFDTNGQNLSVSITG